MPSRFRFPWDFADSWHLLLSLWVFNFNVFAEFIGSPLGEAAKRADPPTSAVKALNPRAGRTRGRRERKGDVTIPINPSSPRKEMSGNSLFNYLDICLLII